MKKMGLYSLLVFFVIIVFASCNYQDSINTNITTDTLLTKTIIFPNSLLKLNGTQFQKTDSLICEIKDKTKIISIIDGNCMKCIVNQLNKIDSTFNSIMPGDDNLIIFILNVSKEDSVYFMRHLQPAIKATGIILWDNDFNFERQNHLFTPKVNLRTFMINNENKIIQYGNPIMNPDIIFEYQEKLEMNILKQVSKLEEEGKLMEIALRLYSSHLNNSPGNMNNRCTRILSENKLAFISLS